MGLEVVKHRVLLARLHGVGYETVEDPVAFVNNQVSLGEEKNDNVKSLVRWLNETIMRLPSEHTRGELFISALNEIYGEEWSVLVADPMSMIKKIGKSLMYRQAVARIQ